MITTSVVLTSCLPDDVVVSEYRDLAHAQQEGAFERGWLPPVLPRSSLHIIESNDLDVNIGIGSFDFDPADLKSYLEQLRSNFAAESTEGKSDWCVTIHAAETTWILNLPKDGKRARYRMTIQR